MFTEAIDVTGIFLAKLDGTARGGIVIAIKDQLDIPVKFVGLGEEKTYEIKKSLRIRRSAGLIDF
jgi:signal recognition particle GTPase